MYETIKNFHKQFLYKPEIINRENFIKKTSFIIVGMGGSGLAPKLLKDFNPKLNIIIHQDYGLPNLLIEELRNKLIILSSYSGNTEEVVDAFEKAKEKGLSMVVITIGGKLLSLAKENKVPYIQLPDTHIQPRMALGFSFKAFLKIMGEEDQLKKTSELAKDLDMDIFEKNGKILAEKIKNHIPIIYASVPKASLAQIWKITLNETGKIPAFHNVFPELNHNEMNGFDVKDSIKELCGKFCFIFLKDSLDNPKIQKRMEVTEKLYKDRGLSVETIEVRGKNAWSKIFSAVILADWTAYYTALEYGLESEKVPMVEEFKKLILE